MDKIKKRNAKSKQIVENKGINKDHEDYGYDFVPNLDAWLNSDEQREKAEELENISE